LAVWFAGCAASPPEPPNVLLITVDTLRADRLGVYGFPADTSPNIDRLGASGVVFERAIAASSKTAPSHATIMTSLYPRQHAIGHRNGDSALRDEPTLAESFRRAGYRTAAFVGNILLVKKLGFDRGFDLYDDDLPTPEINRPHVVERRADATTARAIEWIESARGPFFLWVHYQDPHGPYTPPRELVERFSVDPEVGGGPLRVLSGNDDRGGIPSYQVLGELRDPAGYESRYAAEIFYADAAIGRLLAAVDRSGPDALIALTADHGESLGEQGFYYQHTQSTSPEVARVPFILRAPVLQPERRSELVSHVDLMPTLLQLAGLDAPPRARGVALAPILNDAEPAPDRFVFCDNGNEVSAYRGTGFIQMRGTRRAWAKPGQKPGERLRSSRFGWKDVGRWGPSLRQPPVPEPVLAYTRSAVPMNELTPPSAEELERLRALGYAN
jgi:arylsulfatase